MKKYIWQKENWPDFRCELPEKLIKSLSRCRRLQGELLYRLTDLGPDLLKEAQERLLVYEAERTSQIEGVEVNSESIRSSAAKKLGLDRGGLKKPGLYEEGVVEMLFDATSNYNSPLTEKRLFQWHAGLFPLDHERLGNIAACCFRRPENDPMQIISGRVDRPVVNFEAPSADQIPMEIKRFIDWFQKSRNEIDGLMRAAISHLWFITIHPFEDGNGRIARAINDLAMSQDDDISIRAYSLSSQIQSSKKEKNDYYDILEKTQKGDGIIDDWVEWFAGLVERSIKSSKEILKFTLAKAEFWKKFSEVQINERQRKVINRLLDSGQDGFEGGLNNKKYVGIAKVSRQTASRELKDLLDKGLLHTEGQGKSTRYYIKY